MSTTKVVCIKRPDVHEQIRRKLGLIDLEDMALDFTLPGYDAVELRVSQTVHECVDGRLTMRSLEDVILQSPAKTSKTTSRT